MGLRCTGVCSNCDRDECLNDIQKEKENNEEDNQEDNEEDND